MGIRHLSRQRAMQLLYALEFGAPDEDPADAERRFLNLGAKFRRGWGPFARQLCREVWRRRAELDRDIAPLLRGWTLDRLPRVDRVCLRMALAELRFFPDIPLRVTLDEYIELARAFSTEEAPQYINAVLDHFARECPQKDFQTSRPGAPAAGGAKPPDSAPSAPAASADVPAGPALSP